MLTNAFGLKAKPDRVTGVFGAFDVGETKKAGVMVMYVSVTATEVVAPSNALIQ